jgi:hypothetical protein
MQDVISCTLPPTHFVIEFINFTCSKLVELWPMTIPPQIKIQVVTRRKTFLGKNPLVLATYIEVTLLRNPVGKKSSSVRSDLFYVLVVFDSRQKANRG